MQVMHIASRLVPAALLLWAGVAKIADRQGSILAVNAYDVLPASLVRPVATLLPWAEVVVAALLVLGLFVRTAGVALAALVSVYLIAMGQAKARGLAISCGCFGGGGAGSGVTWWDLLRDVPLLGAGLYLAWRPSGPLQLDRWFLATSEPEVRDEERDEWEDGRASDTVEGRTARG